jgi:hypothetical protein
VIQTNKRKERVLHHTRDHIFHSSMLLFLNKPVPHRSRHHRISLHKYKYLREPKECTNSPRIHHHLAPSHMKIRCHIKQHKLKWENTTAVSTPTAHKNSLQTKVKELAGERGPINPDRSHPCGPRIFVSTMVPACSS